MKKTSKQKGKASKYVIYSERGLLKDDQWKSYLKNRPIQLVTKIRSHLKKQIPGLADKFNYKSRYFGLRVKDDKDKIYIYVQKKGLRIDLCIGRENEEKLKRAGFNVKYVNNYQGRSGWLTGWRVPHDTKKFNNVLKWITKAFEESY
jgi:hypothetical protein